MKWRILIGAIAAAALVIGMMFFLGHRAMAQRVGGYGPGWGPGMMWGAGPGVPGWGGGPGFMWGGPGPWGDENGFGAYSQLPQDKRAQLRDLAVDSQRKMVSQAAAMEELALSYSKAVQKFPLDRDAATKAWEGMESIRKQIFALQLDSMSKAQQILGKEQWEELHGGWSPGRRGPVGPR